MQSPDNSQPTFWAKFREAIWPMMEEDEEDNKPVPPTGNPKWHIDDENLDQAFDLISKYAQGEGERLKTIEAKATLFLSTISIATSLVIASNALLTGNTERSWSVICSVVASFILTVYASRTVWFSVKTLERGNYSILSFSDLNHAGSKSAYKKHLILTIRKKTVANYDAINAKVDHMTMAQAYYKRAIIAICFYAFVIVLFFVFGSATATPGKTNVNKAIKSIVIK